MSCSQLKFSPLLSRRPDSLCGHSPPSSYNSSRTLQHALLQPPQTLPCYPPLTVPPLAACAEYQNPAIGKQGPTKGSTQMHTSRPPSRSSHTSLSCFSATMDHISCHFYSLAVRLWEVLPPYTPTSLILQGSMFISVLFIVIPKLLVGFWKFYSCTPIKLLRLRASVKLMKCKCQSFCLPLFFIFSPLVQEHASMLCRKDIWIPNSLLH